MTLRVRLTLLVSTVVAVAIAGGAVFAHLSASSELRGEVDQFLRERVDSVTAFGAFGRPREGGFGPGQNRGVFQFDSVIQLVDSTGEVTGRPDQPVLPVSEGDLAVARGASKTTYRDVSVDGRTYRMVTAPIRGRGAVQVGRSLQETQDVLDGLRNRLGLVGLIGTATAALVSWVVARRFVAPVERLTASAQHIAQTEDLTAPIEVSGTDEVGQLAASFNMMLRALQTSREQQRRLVMDASHELRTPLTALRTNIELLLSAPDMTAVDRAELLSDLRTEMEEMSSLVAELVELATDRRSDEEPALSEDLLDIVDRVADRARRRHERDVQVIGEPYDLVLRAASMERALSNLIENAIKFSPADTVITVTVNGPRVEVADHGPGIAQEDLPHLFQRFYRSTEARSLPGSGLGLSIVDDIVDAHNGTTFAHNRAEGGAVVGFELGLDVAPADPHPDHSSDSAPSQSGPRSNHVN